MTSDLFRRLKRFAGRALDARWTFDDDYQERRSRQEFFYKAFKALSYNRISGDYAEFGSFGGLTIALAYQEAARHGHPANLWAFDSFAGFPAPSVSADEHPVWTPGAMAMSLEEFHAICAHQRIPRNRYRTIPGFYDKSLSAPEAVAYAPDISLAYIDCDLYSSTKAVLAFLKPRIKHGMIFAFDDYFCGTATQMSGERAAMLEAFPSEGRWRLVPYVQFGWAGQSFVVEDSGPLPKPHGR